MQPFIPDICLIVMQFIGGTEALSLRCLSKSWLEASEHLTITLQCKLDETKFFEIANHEMMKHVSELQVLSKLSVPSFRKFVEIPTLTFLKSLQMTDTGKFEGIFDDFDDDATRDISYALENEIGLIANSKVFSNLENLSIEYHEIGNRVIEDIFNSSVLTNLKTLSLQGNYEFNNFGIASSGTSNLSNLRELSLMWEVIRLKDLELMKENRIFVNLTKLIISGVSMLPEETFSSAITDPVWLNLKELHLNTKVSTSVSKIKCALQLEKLTIEVSDIEACKALADNKTISQSLKYLNVGRINVNQENLKDTVTLIRIGEQFEKFVFHNNTNKYY